ncbi:hypothetical protein HYU06_05855 [Candidatus Woesearchaeota archaeon]|nr:hypothetical protein [Candidatus Woesearchaeota archaeon]
MSKLITKVQWGGAVNSFALVDLTDWSNLIITRSTELKSNSAEITLLNPQVINLSGTIYRRHVNSANNKLKFAEGDTIKIYVAYVETNREIDTSATSNDLLMSAEIQEVTCNLSQSKAEIRLKCIDKSYVALQKLWAFSYTDNDTTAPDGTGWRSPTLIQNIIRWTAKVDENISGKTYYDKYGNLVSNGNFQIDARLRIAGHGEDNGGGLIDATRPDGSIFPIISLAKVFKPIYEWIDELSTMEYTNDFSIAAESASPPTKRKYIFYIDELNRFNWFYPADETTPGETITEGDTSTGNILYSANLTYATYDIVNMVIFNAGDDMNGSGILDYFYDRASTAPKLQMVYKAWTDIARQMKADEVREGARLGKTTITRVHDDEYSYPANYTGYNGTGLPSWDSTTTIASNTAFNNSFRSATIIKGKARAQALTSNRGSPRWRGTLTIKGKKHAPGDLARVSVLSCGVSSIDLRFKQIQHNITKEDWQTILTVEQDERLVTLSS